MADLLSIVLGSSDQKAVRIYTNGARKTDLSAISRWVVTLAGTSVDSATNPTLFNWTTYTDAEGDLLVLAFGTLDLDVGQTLMYLTYYDGSHPLGRQLDTTIPVLISGTATGAAAVSIGATLQDGSYSQTIQLGDLVTKNPWVDVRSFGAVGDDSTDDTATINAAATYAGATKVLYFPPYLTFRTTGTVTILGPCSGTGAIINYEGTGVALRIGSETAYTQTMLFELPTVRQSTYVAGSGWSAADTGVELLNLYHCRVYVQEITGFAEGLSCKGVGRGFAYNHIHSQLYSNNKISMSLNPVSAATSGQALNGWVNENTFYGGRFFIASAEGNEVSGLIYLELRDTGTVQVPNNNRFCFMSLEGNAPQWHIDCGGPNNVFYWCRYETSGGIYPKVRWNEHALENRIEGGIYAHLIVFTEVSGANRNSWMHGYGQVIEGGGSGADGVLKLQNTSSNTSGALTVLSTGVDPLATNATDWSVLLSATELRGKASADTWSRLFIDWANGRIHFGDGATETITKYMQLSGEAIAVLGSDLQLGIATGLSSPHLRFAQHQHVWWDANGLIRKGVDPVSDTDGNTVGGKGASYTCSDGGTITHGFGKTPNWAIATSSVAGECCSVTARGATTLTIAIKKCTDGSAGTASQTIYVLCGD